MSEHFKKYLRNGGQHAKRNVLIEQWTLSLKQMAFKCCAFGTMKYLMIWKSVLEIIYGNLDTPHPPQKARRPLPRFAGRGEKQITITILNRYKWFLIFVLLLLSGLSGLIFSLYQHRDNEPPETLRTFHYPALLAKQLAGDPDAGRKIFKEFCAACHESPPQIDIHAPLIGDKKAWQLRQQSGVDALLAVTINGSGAMPARGGCFECSDEQLRKTILYILGR